MSDWDVIVVGGHIAGAATALLLARAGMRVILVDRDRHGSDTLSTHGLMRAGVLQLTRWGVLPEIIAAGTPAISQVVFHYADSEPVSVAIKPSAGVEALYAPRRYLIDRLIVDAAAAAGAEVLHETIATRLLRGPAGRVAGVQIRSRSGRSGDLHAPLTVGADGIRSTVARYVDAPLVQTGSNASAVLYRYFDDLPAAGYEWAYGDHSAAGFLPTNEATCVFVATSPARLRRLRRAGADRAFAELIGSAAPSFVDRLADATPASRMHGWAGAPGYLRQSWGPGWALVGDAGYFKDPITTHGMTDALRDAELFAEAALAGPSRFDEAAAAYQHTRDRLSYDMINVTEAVAGYDWNLDRLRRLLREVSAAMGEEVDHLQSLSLDPRLAPMPLRDASSQQLR